MNVIRRSILGLTLLFFIGLAVLCGLYVWEIGNTILVQRLLVTIGIAVIVLLFVYVFMLLMKKD